MTTDKRDVVSSLRSALADKVGEDRFDLWFGAGTQLSLGEDQLVVSVANTFYQDWLRNNFRREIEASCLETLGRPIAVSFQIDASLANAPRPSVATAPATGEPPRPTLPLPSAAAPIAPSRRRRYEALDSFVVGESNRLAHASASSVARSLGVSSPLVLHGPTGVGKSHLVEGILTAARQANPGVHAVLLSSEQFTTYFLGALHGSGLPSFRRKYRGVELLIVEDIQFLTNKRATLTELLYTIDTLLREGRQLVFTADRPIDQLGELGPELVARLEGGLICSLASPEYEVRLGIVRRMSRESGLTIGDDVLSYVASHLNTHARALAGALKRLEAASVAHSRPITVALAEEMLADVVRASSKPVRLPDIEAAVCNAFGLEPKTLRSGDKGRRANHPRMLAMWLARKHTRAALSEIGDYFGGRSHSTVISAQKRVNASLDGGAPLELADRAWKVDDAIRRVEQKLLAG